MSAHDRIRLTRAEDHLMRDPLGELLEVWPAKAGLRPREPLGFVDRNSYEGFTVTMQVVEIQHVRVEGPASARFFRARDHQRARNKSRESPLLEERIGCIARRRK